MSKKINIALIQFGLFSNFRRGPQRFFPLLFKNYYSKSLGFNNLFFFTDVKSSEFLNNEFKQLGLKSRIVSLVNIRNRLKIFLENLDFIFKIIYYKIDIIHICNYNHRIDYYERLKAVYRLPKFLKPKVIININYCGFREEFLNSNHEGYNQLRKYDELFKSEYFDGIYTWYKDFKDFCIEKEIINKNVKIHAISSYFCDNEKYKPGIKKNQIIFASSLSNTKRPLIFLDAIISIIEQETELISNWEFIICGQGFYEKQIKTTIFNKNLAHRIKFYNDIHDLSSFFASSKCFVSTQKYENFTSLSMNEAMAAGNAILAFDVGQTNEYVKNNENGLLTKNETSSGLKEILVNYLNSNEMHDDMSKKSYKLAREVHNEAKFINELDSYWKNIVKN